MGSHLIICIYTISIDYYKYFQWFKAEGLYFYHHKLWIKHIQIWDTTTFENKLTALLPDRSSHVIYVPCDLYTIQINNAPLSLTRLFSVASSCKFRCGYLTGPEYLADTEPYVEFHSSAVTSVPCLCSDTHSISPVNDGGSLYLFYILYFLYIYLFRFFVKGNVLYDI